MNLDKTIEEMEQQILNYTQNITAEDEEVLEIMRLLDENENRNVEDNSLLAPLSQPITERKSSENQLNKTLVPESFNPEDDPDSEDEFFNDFNVTMAELEVFR